MKKNITIILSALAILLLAVSCSKENNGEADLTPKSITLTAAAPIAIQSSNEFGIELFTKVTESEKNKNLMLSPLSASTALTMLLNGCGGDTYSQLQGTLKYPAEMSISEINEAYKSLVVQLLKVDPRVQLALANAIFYRNGFDVKPPFLATMSDD